MTLKINEVFFPNPSIVCFFTEKKDANSATEFIILINERAYKKDFSHLKKDQTGLLFENFLKHLASRLSKRYENALLSEKPPGIFNIDLVLNEIIHGMVREAQNVPKIIRPT